MLISVAVAAIASALLLASSAALRAETPVPPAVPATCQLIEVTNVDMMTAATGEVGVPVKINGKDAALLVDTGSIYSSIALPLARELKLPLLPFPKGLLVFAGGVDVRQITKFDTMSIGSAHGEHAIFLVEPPAVSDYDHDGLLGPDIMHQYDVEFDFAGGKFNMFAPQQCAGNVVYWTRTAYATLPIKVDRLWHIRLEVALDGKPLEVLLDSGAPRSLLAMEDAHDLFGIDEKSPGTVSLGDIHLNRTSGTTTYRYPFKTMNLGGVAVYNPDLLLVPRKMLGGPRGPTAILGISILRQLHLYIAYKEQKLYVTPAQVIEPPAISATPAPPLASQQTVGPPAKPPVASMSVH